MKQRSKGTRKWPIFERAITEATIVVHKLSVFHLPAQTGQRYGSKCLFNSFSILEPRYFDPFPLQPSAEATKRGGLVKTRLLTSLKRERSREGCWEAGTICVTYMTP